MNKYLKFIFTAVLFAGTTGVGLAGTSYLDSLALKILNTNAALQSAVHSDRAECLSLRAENQLAAPEIEVEHLFGEKGVHDKTGVTLSQSFEWPGIYRARSRAASLAEEAMRLRREAVYRDKMLETKLLMLDIIYTRKERTLLDSVEANISEMLASTEEGFRRGELTILDVNRMRIERVSLRTRSSAASLRQTGLRASLEALAGGADVSEIWNALVEFPDESVYSEDVYARAVDESDADVAATRAELEAARARANALRMTSYPGFSIGYRYSREEGHDFHGFTAGITLPFLKKNYSAAVASEAAIAASFDLQEVRVKALSPVYSLMSEVRRLTADNAEYQRVFEESDNLRLLYMAYTGGEMNTLDYLTGVNYFLEANIAYFESLYRQYSASIKLNALLPLHYKYEYE